MKSALAAALLAAGCAGALRIEPAGDALRVAAPLPQELREGPIEPAVAERFLRFCRIDPDTGAEGPPMLGDYRREGSRLIFTPGRPAVPGGRYRAVAGSERVEYLAPERPRGEPAAVTAVYPSADRLPANLLKFYIHFSRPMQEEEAIFDRIRLVRVDGTVVADPWRRLGLWSEGTRLTLLIHPGRIKRGVNLNEEEGPVLDPGRVYSLEVGGDVLDAEGRPLGRPFRKSFTAVEEDHERPSWRVEPPRAGTRDPLVVRFGEPMDRWLAARCLRVMDVEGAVEVGDGERLWLFRPQRPWAAADHAIHVDPLLEDLAGNTPVRRFEEEAGKAEETPAPIRFRPRQEP